MPMGLQRWLMTLLILRLRHHRHDRRRCVAVTPTSLPPDSQRPSPTLLLSLYLLSTTTARSGSWTFLLHQLLTSCPSGFFLFIGLAFSILKTTSYFYRTFPSGTYPSTPDACFLVSRSNHRTEIRVAAFATYPSSSFSSLLLSSPSKLSISFTLSHGPPWGPFGLDPSTLSTPF